MGERLIEGLTPARLAAMIDHTFLKASGTPGDITGLCRDAARYRFASVAVHPCEVERCAALLKGTGVHVAAVVGFPLGQNTAAVKAFELRDAITRGASEIDMVLNVRDLQAGKTGSVLAELRDEAAACKAHGVVSKVILETCYLTDEEKRTACGLALEAGLDFVKTSTGFGTGGATVHDVELMRAAVGPVMGVKASGGIRTLDTALAMIRAGATRLGTSSGVALVEELKGRSR
jgi:deoxyribose-phosphate aldolase